MRLLRLLPCTLALLVLAAATAHAQDAQYWAQKYGTKGLLLSGVAIGGGVDLSTTYYNPGGLVLLGDSMKVIAVKAFDFSNVSIDDATNTGENISEPRNSVLPASSEAPSTSASPGALPWPTRCSPGSSRSST